MEELSSALFQHDRPHVVYGPKMMPNAYENTTSLMTQIEKYFLNEDLLVFDKTTERIFFSFQLILQR